MFRCLVGWSGECGGAVDGAGAGAVCAGKEGKEMKQRGAAQRKDADGTHYRGAMRGGTGREGREATSDRRSKLLIMNMNS